MASVILTTRDPSSLKFTSLPADFSGATGNQFDGWENFFRPGPVTFAFPTSPVAPRFTLFMLLFFLGLYVHFEGGDPLSK